MLDTDQNRLISHRVLSEDLAVTIEEIKTRIQQAGDKPYVTVARQMTLLQQLCEFDFGRFLLQNQGINGYWTHYMLTHPWFGRKTGKNNRDKPCSELENFILNRAPTMLATQQRFEIFLNENQKSVQNNAKLACVPCGMMGELLYLDFQKIKNIELIGIDYDAETLKDAEGLAQKRGLSSFLTLIQRDAWDLKVENEYDLISSNGLNIYEPEHEKVRALYKEFYKALKPGGKLVSSFVTYPPGVAASCEWNMQKLNTEDLLLQRIIFADIIEGKWQSYRSTQETREQLNSAGFKKIDFINDDARMFPTVVAEK